MTDERQAVLLRSEEGLGPWAFIDFSRSVSLEAGHRHRLGQAAWDIPSPRCSRETLCRTVMSNVVFSLFTIQSFTYLE